MFHWHLKYYKMASKGVKVKKFHIRKGDTVMILSGDEKGKKGKVLEMNRQKYAAIVEGKNMITKHVKPSATNPNGGIENYGSANTFE